MLHWLYMLIGTKCHRCEILVCHLGAQSYENHIQQVRRRREREERVEEGRMDGGKGREVRVRCERNIERFRFWMRYHILIFGCNGSKASSQVNRENKNRNKGNKIMMK